MASKSSSASLREIAMATKLSITTVSRALRKQGEISDETRLRVLEAAKQLWSPAERKNKANPEAS